MWKLREGWQPLNGIGPGPFADDEFEALFAAYCSSNGFDVSEARANAPYDRVEESQADEGESPAGRRRRG